MGWSVELARLRAQVEHYETTYNKTHAALLDLLPEPARVAVGNAPIGVVVSAIERHLNELTPRPANNIAERDADRALAIVEQQAEGRPQTLISLGEVEAEMGADGDAWQSMDASPHDGTPVRLCWINGPDVWHEEIGAWNERTSAWVAWPSPAFGERVFTPPDGWQPREDPDAWMDKAKFSRFKAGLSYARHQTLAGMALTKLTSVEAYHVWSAIQRGAERTDRNALDPAQPRLRGPAHAAERVIDFLDARISALLDPVLVAQCGGRTLFGDDLYDLARFAAPRTDVDDVDAGRWSEEDAAEMVRIVNGDLGFLAAAFAAETMDYPGAPAPATSGPAADPNRWRPIAEAPRDGTAIEVGWPGTHHVAVGPFPAAWWENRGWTWVGTDDNEVILPVLWRPLPDAENHQAGDET